MTVKRLIKVTEELDRKLEKQILINIKYRFLFNFIQLSRVDTGQLRGNTYVRRYPLKRFNKNRRIRNASSAAFSQRRFIRPFSQRDIITQTAPYAAKWARKDGLTLRAYQVTRQQMPAIIAGALK